MSASRGVGLSIECTERGVVSKLCGLLFCVCVLCLKSQLPRSNASKLCLLFICFQSCVEFCYKSCKVLKTRYVILCLINN
jgi:hypothetical protein